MQLYKRGILVWSVWECGKGGRDWIVGERRVLRFPSHYFLSVKHEEVGRVGRFYD